MSNYYYAQGIDMSSGIAEVAPVIAPKPKAPAKEDPGFNWSALASGIGTGLTTLFQRQSTPANYYPVAQPAPAKKTNIWPFVALGGVGVAAFLVLRKKK